MENRIDTINFRIARITNSEKITKDELRFLSRELLEQLLEDGDVRHVNRLIEVLTPMNKKTAILFFKALIPFKWVDETGVFGAMKKKVSEEMMEGMRTFLQDPLNNIWSWAEQNVEVEAKPFKVEKVTKIVERAIKEGIDQNAIIRAVFEGGIDADALVAILKELA